MRFRPEQLVISSSIVDESECKPPPRNSYSDTKFALYCILRDTVPKTRYEVLKDAWPLAFEEYRECCEEGSWLKDQELTDDDESFFGFLRKWGGWGASHLDDIIEFCKESELAARRREGTFSATSARKAWLNDLEHLTGYFRQYVDLLTANQLRMLLEQKRFGCTYLPDADRRLCCIHNLDGDCIKILLRSASCNMFDMLLEAIGKYLAAQTAISVRISTQGILLFRMELHLTFCALRKSGPGFKDLLNHQRGNGPDRELFDLSFLAPPATRRQYSWLIHRAHTSIVVQGSDRFRWCCFAFIDNAFEDLSCKESEDEEDVGEESEGTEDEEPEDVNEDRVISHGELDGVAMDANLPIWDPRIYFVCALDSRTQQMLKEWEKMGRKVTGWIDKKKEMYDRSLIQQPHFTLVEEALQWVDRVGHLLRWLQDRLSEAIEAWANFDAPGGSIDYLFKDFNDQVDVRLHSIRETYRALKDIEANFKRLDSRCQKWQKALQSRENHRLTRESHRTNLETHKINLQSRHLNKELKIIARDNHRTTKLALSMNQIWTPFSIALACLGAGQQQQMFPFRQMGGRLILCFVAILFGVRIIVFLTSRLSKTPLVQKTHARLSASQLYRVILLADDSEDDGDRIHAKDDDDNDSANEYHV